MSGTIQIIPLHGTGNILVCNDDGHLEKLSRNIQATKLYGKYCNLSERANRRALMWW